MGGFCPAYVVCPLFVSSINFCFSNGRMNLVEPCHVTWAGLIIGVLAIFCGFLVDIHMPGTCVAHAHHMPLFHYVK